MGRHVIRRDFLRGAAAGGLGLWAAGQGEVRGRSANEKLNVAFIGVGRRGGDNVRLVAGENVVALCDVDGDRLGKVAANYPRARTYHDFRKLLEQKDVDAVVISTPDHTHAVTAAAALRLGKHVYCEKPLTHSIHEARVLAKLANEAKVATQMGNMGHSGQSTQEIVRLIKAGTIGEVREVHAWTNRPSSWPQGLDRPSDTPPIPEHLKWDLWLGPAAERPYHPAYLPFKWRGWWDFGTGALGDMACHVIDAAFWALDLKNPSTVSATGEPRKPESAPKWEVIRYEFPARGDLPPLTLTWYDGGKRPPDDLLPPPAVVKGQPKQPDNGTLYIGSKGKLFVPDEYSRRFKLLPEGDFADYKPPAPIAQPINGHHTQWVEACKTGSPTGTSFDYSAALTETVLLGVVAFRTGQELSWDASNMRATNCPAAEALIHPPYRKGWSL